MNKEKTIVWHDCETWYCEECNHYIDETKEEMEMHECKQKEVA